MCFPSFIFDIGHPIISSCGTSTAPGSLGHEILYLVGVFIWHIDGFEHLGLIVLLIDVACGSHHVLPWDT